MLKSYYKKQISLERKIKKNIIRNTTPTPFNLETKLNRIVATHTNPCVVLKKNVYRDYKPFTRAISFYGGDRYRTFSGLSPALFDPLIREIPTTIKTIPNPNRKK